MHLSGLFSFAEPLLKMVKDRGVALKQVARDLDLNYSSAKFHNTGFRYSLGLDGALKDISENT
jgi:hypothetical protein